MVHYLPHVSYLIISKALNSVLQVGLLWVYLYNLTEAKTPDMKHNLLNYLMTQSLNDSKNRYLHDREIDYLPFHSN